MRSGIMPVALIALICLLVLSCSRSDRTYTGTLDPLSPEQATIVAARLAAVVQDPSKTEGCTGAVLVASSDMVVFESGIGEADQATSLPNTTKTRFLIGSVTKSITAVLVLQLVEKGKIRLDAPLREYLSGYPVAYADDITIHHLLSQTSGVPAYEDLATYRSHFTDGVLYRPEDLIDNLPGYPLHFSPGTKYEYSNANYQLLGVVIERVTGLPYAEVLKENIVEPLGLENTGYDPQGLEDSQLAQGYLLEGNELKRTGRANASFSFASGGIYSTVEDLFTWTRALVDGSLLSPESARMLIEPQSSGLESYGFGVAVRSLPMRVDVRFRGGSVPGFKSRLMLLSARDSTIIVLCNVENADEIAFAETLARELYK